MNWRLLTPKTVEFRVNFLLVNLYGGGIFKITHEINEVRFRRDFSHPMKVRKIQNVCHASLLRMFAS